MPTIRLTKTGLLFFLIELALLVVVFVSRNPNLLVLSGTLAAIFLTSLILALLNVWLVELRVPKRRPVGSSLLLFLERKWGTSYALWVKAGDSQEGLARLKGHQRVVLRFRPPPRGMLSLLIVSKYPFGFFRVAKTFDDLHLILKKPDSSWQAADRVAGLTEYDGRHPWSRLDWKALARLQRPLVRQGEEEPFPPHRRPWLVYSQDRPSVWPASLAYLTVVLTAYPFLLKAPLWLGLGFLGGVCYGLFRALSRKKALVSENLGALAVLLVAVFSLPGLSLTNLWARLAGFTLSVVLVKTLSQHAPRDVLHLYLLAFLLLILQTMEGTALLWRPLLLFYAVLFPSFYLSSVLLEGFSPKVFWRPLLLFLGPAVLVSWGLIRYAFFFLPAWSWSGLSNLLELGEISSLKLDPRPIGYLFLEERGKVYLKAFVYGDYHRGRWSIVWLPLRCQGRQERYQLDLKEPLPALPYLRCPLKIEAPFGKFHPQRLPLPAARPGTYYFEEAEFSFGSEEPLLFLQVPPELEERLKPLAKLLKGRDLWQTLENLQNFLAHDFTYSLSPGQPEGDPVSWFLFESRRGFCEHFASAAVLLLRVMGYPARVVTGLVTEEYTGGHYLLRASGAHAWVEVWNGQTWHPFDPTPPRRGLWSLGNFSFGFLKRFFPWGLLALLPLAGVYLFFRYRRSADPVEEFLRLFEGLGEKKAPSETMAEFVRRLQENYPALSKELLNFLNLYHEVVFGEKGSKDRLRISLKDIRTRIQQQVKGSGRYHS